MTKKAVVAFSGGQDSTTCLFFALDQGYDVLAVTIFYGQRHAIELDAARMVIDYARHCYPGSRIDHEVIDLPVGILQGTSPLVSDAPLEQYADPASLPGGLEKTFVPMRNQLFLTLAANRAFVHNAPVLITGICEEDFGGYPDCREVFLTAFGEVCDQGTFTAEAGFPGGLTLLAPLMHLTKAQTVGLAWNLPGCYYAMALTHTAYDGAYPPLGKDHATLLRQKGFAEAGLADPLIVRAWMDGLMSDAQLPGDASYDLDNLRALREIGEHLPQRRLRKTAAYLALD